MQEIATKKMSLRKKVNERVYNLGSLKISLVHLLFLIFINVSLACIVVNLFIKGNGIFEWWSVFVTAFLIFAYLILRIFTSSGIILGRQVTFLITLFNLFLNLMKTFNIVSSNQYWELTFLIPFVNLICLFFLVFVFVVRKKKFRAIIIPSLKIALVSVIPIIRLYVSMGGNYILPVFNYVVLILAFALFVNALFLNWLNILKITETNIEMLKKGATEFKKASEKVATVNRKIDSFNNGIGKMKSFWRASGAAFKEFFAFRKTKEAISEPKPALLIEERKNETNEDITYKDAVTVRIKERGDKSIAAKLYNKVKNKLKRQEKDGTALQYDDDGEMILCDKAENDKRQKDNIYNKLIKPFKTKK